MEKCIKRLMNCGYSEIRAYKTCIDFVTNLSLVDLEFFVLSMEKIYVGTV